MSNVNPKAPLPRVVVVALAVAAVALLVAFGATAIAFMAVSRSESTSDSSGATAQASTTGGVEDGGNLVQPQRATSATQEPPEVRPVPDFQLFYEKVSLKIPPDPNCRSVGIDIDGPRIDAGTVDFTRNECSAHPDSLNFDAVSVSDDATPKANASECMERIELAPLGERAELPISSLRVGETLCMLTDKESAIGLGIPQRIAVLEVRGIDDDGTIAAVMTAWNVPD